jgi:hypothetical protein
MSESQDFTYGRYFLTGGIGSFGGSSVGLIIVLTLRILVVFATGRRVLN